MEVIIVCSLALNIVLWLLIRSMKRRAEYKGKSLITMVRALDKLNGIAKKAFVGDHITEGERNFMVLVDLELELEKERQRAKLNA